MRIVHSFASERCNEKTFFIHMCYFILSCLYAKESGFEIVLYCDNKTKDFLKIAPYDKIYNLLEGIEWPGNRLYAWSKFLCMKNEPLGSIHIDGDVFLKDKKLLELLKFDDYDCIVQNIEINGYNWCGMLWDESSDCFKKCKYPIWAKRKCKSMYNCGVIGFNNQKLKDEYFKTYWNMVEQYKIKGIDKHSVPDIIIEQQFLKDLTDFKKYKVKQLLDANKLEKSSKDIGYQHVIGGGKEPNLYKVLELIKQKDINIYKYVMQKLPNELSYLK